MNVHNSDPVPDNDAGTAEPTAACEFIGFISNLIDDDSTSLQAAM